MGAFYEPEAAIIVCMSKILPWILVLGFLVIAALTGFAVVNTVRDSTRPAADLTSELATEAASLLPQTTPTIYPSRTTVVHAVRALARLETVAYSIEKVIVAEENQGPFAFLFGDRLLLVAHGDVIAGVDLGKLQDGDVQVFDEGSVIMILPAPELFVSTLDNEKTFVYDREIGALSQGDVNLESEARRAAEVEIENAALEDGILETARRNAETTITQLLLSLGFRDVTMLPATAVP